MAHDANEQEWEVRETLHAIRDGQYNIATTLQQLIGATQQLAPTHRRTPSHHNGARNVAGLPQAAKPPTQNTNRPLMPTFAENNVEEEVAQPTAAGLLPDNVMAIYNEWDLYLDLVKQNLTFIQYMKQKMESERTQQDKRPRAHNRDLKHAMNKFSPQF